MGTWLQLSVWLFLQQYYLHFKVQKCYTKDFLVIAKCEGWIRVANTLWLNPSVSRVIKSSTGENKSAIKNINI